MIYSKLLHCLSYTYGLLKDTNLLLGDDDMQMAYVCKKSLTKIKRIIQNPKDIKFLIPNKKVDAPGILMVIHESQEPVSYTHLMQIWIGMFCTPRLLHK